MNVVIVNCFDTYDQRVDLLHEFFINCGDFVKVYTSNFCHIKKAVREEKKNDYILVDTIPYSKNLSAQRLISHYKLSKDIFAKLERVSVELLWVLIPPNSFVKSAAKYKRNHPKVKLIFDVIDMWPETIPVERIKKSLPIKMWRRLRDKWIDDADYVVTECNLYHEKLNVNKYKISTLYLAHDVNPFVGNPNPPSNKIALCYLGSINNIIDITIIGSVIQQLKNINQVELHIIGDGEKREELISVAKESGAEVIYHGIVYDFSEKQKIFDMCHFGLNIMKESVFVGLTMKSIDYFEAGLPIINNIHGDTWSLVNEHELGINIDQIDENILKTYDRLSPRHFFETKLSNQVFYDQLTDICEKLKVDI